MKKIDLAVLLLGQHITRTMPLSLHLGEIDEANLALATHDADEVLTYIAAGRVNVVILYTDGAIRRQATKFVQEVREYYPQVGFVLVAAMVDHRLVKLAYQMGISACLAHDTTSTELTVALLAASRGERYLSPQWGQVFVERYTEQTPIPMIHRLSPRQQEVFVLLVNGYGLDEVARRLSVSVRTVENHRTNIMKRLEAKNLISLMLVAYREGVLPLVGE
ncbi:MAG: response regulator transcription factor [Caldilineaceae bacterium]|nr:response regulator transcription factor [Caldilineaceae bacterium]